MKKKQQQPHQNTISTNYKTSANSIILPDGRVNISLLEKEIVHDILNDSKYHAEDEMKKRAVHTSQDYDEFKNFVKCSQLKPVQSRDMGQLFVQRDQQRGSGYSGKQNSVAKRNKFCTIDQNLEKRMSALFNETPDRYCIPYVASMNDRGIESTCTSYQNSPDTKIPNHKTIMFDSMATRKSTKSKTLDQILNLKFTSKNCKHNNKRVTKKTKNKPKEKKTPDLKISPTSSISSSEKIRHEPQNAMDFEKEWKRYCHCIPNIIKYLTMPKDKDINLKELETKLIQMEVDEVSFISIPNQLRIAPEQISKNIFKIGIDPDIMGGIIEALECLLVKNRKDSIFTSSDGDAVDALVYVEILIFVYKWMYAFTECGRFGLSIDFLSETQRLCVSSILDILEEKYNKLLAVRYKYSDGNVQDSATTTNPVINNKKIVQLRALYKL